MSAEHRDQELPINSPELTVVARDGIATTPPLIDPSLLYLGRICPQLDIPLQALKRNRENDPQFALREERQLLAYALWLDYPHATDQIAKVFQINKKRVGKWADYVTNIMGDEWEAFDEVQEQLKDEKEQKLLTRPTSHHLSTLWAPDKGVPDSFVKVLEPHLSKRVAIAQTTSSYSDIAKQTNITYGSARQLLYEARKKIEKRVPELKNYIKLKWSDHEVQRAIRFGNLEGFHIGNVWYGKKEEVEVYRLRINIPDLYSEASSDQTPRGKQPDTYQSRIYPKGKSLEEAQRNIKKRKK